MHSREVMDNHLRVSPGEIKRGKVELDPQESPGEIKYREVEMGSESWTAFASVVPRQLFYAHRRCDFDPHCCRNSH